MRAGGRAARARSRRESVGGAPVRRARRRSRRRGARPVGDVGARRRAEGGEVAPDELGARGEHLHGLRLRVRMKDAERPAAPESRLRSVQQVRPPAHRVEDPAPREVVGMAVLSLEIGEPFLVRERRLLGELPRSLHGLQRVREVRVVVPGRHVAERRPEHRIVARRHEVQRPAHHGRLDDVAAEDRALERLPLEAGHARPEPDVRRRRPLRLHACKSFDRR